MEKSNKATFLQKPSVHRGCVSVSFITGIISSSKNWTVAGSYLSPAPTKKKKTTASDEALTAATNISRFTDTDVKKQSLRSQTVTFAKVMKGAMRYGRIIYKVNLKSYRRKKIYEEMQVGFPIVKQCSSSRVKDTNLGDWLTKVYDMTTTRGDWWGNFTE